MSRGRLVAGLGLGLLLLVAPSAAGAQEADVEEVAIVDADDRALEGGGSATAFSLRLPDDAACQGDSRDGGYRVMSYLVAGGVDPLDITFDGLGPAPWRLGDQATFQHPLFDIETTSFAGIQTQNAEEEGGPGRLQELPGFDLDVFEPGQVPPGRYRLGIACTLLNEITRVWDAQIDVVADPADDPAQLRWSAVGFEPDDGSGSSPAVPVVAAVLVAGAIAIVLVRRPSRPADPTPHRRST